jgi:hypothetical protein
MFNERNFASLFALSLLLATGRNLAPAYATTSTTPSIKPFVCESTSDSSVVEFVNSGNRAVLLVSLAETSDYGGAILSDIPAVTAATTKFTLNAIPSTNTANLLLRLVVQATYSGGTKVFTVAPTSAVSRGTYTICTFDFSKYGLPSGTQITNLAPMVQVSSSASEGGAVYLYNYELNGTAITKRILTTAGCPTF